MGQEASSAPDRVGGLPYNDEFDDPVASVNVFVHEKNGTPVMGLTREDFSVSEDDVQRPIVDFEAVSPAPVHPGLTPDNPTTATQHPVYLVFFVDNQFLRHTDRNRVLRAIQTSLQTGVDDNVRMMVVSHSDEIKVLQPFTDDVGAIIEALRAIRVTDTRLETRDEMHDRIQQKIRRAAKNRHHSYRSQQQELSEVYSAIRDFIVEEDVMLAESLTALRQVFMALTGIGGRRYVVHVSNGMPFAIGADLLHQYAGIFGTTSGAATTSTYSQKRRFDALIGAANAQGITVHAIDATGTDRPEAQIGDSDSRHATLAGVLARETFQRSLRYLAERTGGMTVINEDDFVGEIHRMKATLSTFYKIIFELPSGGLDTVHQIEVHLSQDKELELSYSRTFVNKSPESRIQDLVTSGLFFDVSKNPLEIRVATGQPIQATADRWQLPIEVSIPVTSLALTRQGDEYVGKAMHFVALMNIDGKTTDMQRQTHTFRIPVAEYETKKDESFPIFMRLLLDEGQHRIVTAVHDVTTRQTSIQKFTVGDAGPS